MTIETNRSSEMNLMHEDLARAQMSERLGEAQTLRRGRRIVLARRMSRRAERAALQARLDAGPLALSEVDTEPTRPPEEPSGGLVASLAPASEGLGWRRGRDLRPLRDVRRRRRPPADLVGGPRSDGAVKRYCDELHARATCARWRASSTRPTGSGALLRQARRSPASTPRGSGGTAPRPRAGTARRPRRRRCGG